MCDKKPVQPQPPKPQTPPPERRQVPAAPPPRPDKQKSLPEHVEPSKPWPRRSQ